MFMRPIKADQDLAVETPVSHLLSCRMCWTAIASSWGWPMQLQSSQIQQYRVRFWEKLPHVHRVIVAFNLVLSWNTFIGRDEGWLCQSIVCRVALPPGIWPVEEWCGAGKHHQGHQFHGCCWKLRVCHTETHTIKEKDRCYSFSRLSLLENKDGIRTIEMILVSTIFPPCSLNFNKP